MEETSKKVRHTKKVKYLPLYYEWMETGNIPYKEHRGICGGLCSIFHNDKMFKLINPPNGAGWYWGCSWDDSDRGYAFSTGFTPMRQTVVLLMAAMNNEL